MRRGGRLRHRHVLELDIGVAEMLEEPLAVAEQHRHQVDRELIDQSRPEALLGEVAPPIKTTRFTPASACAPARALSKLGRKL